MLELQCQCLRQLGALKSNGRARDSFWRSTILKAIGHGNGVVWDEALILKFMPSFTLFPNFYNFQILALK